MLLKTLEREFFGYYEQHPKPCYLPWQPAGKSLSGLQSLLPFDYPCTWEWLGPGGLPGLQNLWRVALRAAVGSTPIHSRLLFHLDHRRWMIDNGPSFIVHSPI